MTTSFRVKWARPVNIALLIAGMGIGQGSIFLMQSWLWAQGEVALLAAFATHFSFAILGTILVDGGASIFLARHVASAPEGDGISAEIWRTVGEASIFRLSLAALVGVAALIYAFQFAGDQFSRSYVIFALPGVLVWAVNVVGVLDGIKLSGISGVTSAIAYAASAAGLLLARHVPLETAGSILGGLFSAGYVVTVAAQWGALRLLGISPALQAPTWLGLRKCFTEGVALLLQLLPGQLFVRGQLVLSTIYLGAELTALFAYVKQIVVAVTMIIAVVLRVDFPGLVENMSRTEVKSLASIFGAQKTSLYSALGFTLTALLIAALGLIIPIYGLSKAAPTLLAFAPTILTVSLSLMMIQAMAAIGAYAAVALIVAIGAGIGMAISAALVTLLSIYGLLLGEAAFHAIGFYLVYLYLRRKRHAGVAKPTPAPLE